jgi:hypothetical protein
MSDHCLRVVLYEGADGKTCVTPEVSCWDSVRTIAQAYRAAGIKVIREGEYAFRLKALGLWRDRCA